MAMEESPWAADPLWVKTRCYRSATLISAAHRGADIITLGPRSSISSARE